MKCALIETPLGLMRAIGNETALFRLEQAGGPCSLEEGITAPIRSIEKELNAYFAGTLQTFQTPLCPIGTPFQLLVWKELQRVPYGKTCSYADLAKAIGKPSAFRAVGMTNGANPLPIIIPCHRVINTDGKLGGYNGGIHRKQWLLNHETSSSIRSPSDNTFCRSRNQSACLCG